jgi:antitoxin component of RelBE/YafQ-DinJ toxin-antitoxin module
MQDTLTIRIDAALKQEAEKKAAGRDETLSQVVRRALRNYISERELRVGRTPRKKADKNAVFEDRVKEANNELGPSRNTEATWLQRFRRSHTTSERTLQMRCFRMAAPHRVE